MTGIAPKTKYKKLQRIELVNQVLNVSAFTGVDLRRSYMDEMPAIYEAGRQAVNLLKNAKMPFIVLGEMFERGHLTVAAIAANILWVEFAPFDPDNDGRIRTRTDEALSREMIVAPLPPKQQTYGLPTTQSHSNGGLNSVAQNSLRPEEMEIRAKLVDGGNLEFSLIGTANGAIGAIDDGGVLITEAGRVWEEVNSGKDLKVCSGSDIYVCILYLHTRTCTHTHTCSCNTLVPVFHMRTAPHTAPVFISSSRSFSNFLYDYEATQCSHLFLPLVHFTSLP